MSFAGHVFDMIARLKANEQRKRRPFDREVDAQGAQIKAEYLQPPTPEQMANVRQMIAMERRRELIRTVILSSLALLSPAGILIAIFS